MIDAVHACLPWPHWPHLLGSRGDLIGYLASSLVLAAFTMKSMGPLRLTAVLSNFAFIAYAVAEDALPIFILHSILLPLNIVRLGQSRTRQYRQTTILATTGFGRLRRRRQPDGGAKGAEIRLSPATRPAAPLGLSCLMPYPDPADSVSNLDYRTRII